MVQYAGFYKKKVSKKKYITPLSHTLGITYLSRTRHCELELSTDLIRISIYQSKHYSFCTFRF